MAQIPVRLTMKEMTFPLLSTQQGPTVFDSRGDLTHIQGVSAQPKFDAPATLGYPGLYYAHNVLPSISGWQSVGYEEKLSGSATSGFFDIEMCQGAIIQDNYPFGTSIRTYIASVYSGGSTFLYYKDQAGNWATPTIDGTGLSLSVPGKVPMTVANTNGVTYIYFQGAGTAYVLDTVDGILYPREFLGLEISTIRGILASNGYIIAWSRTAVAWSSTVDVEDFVPSEITGAGGGSIQEIEGDIVYCRKVDLGFVIFSDINAVIALFTSNELFPFEFRELNAVGGVTGQHLVSREDVASKMYCYTTAGIQEVQQVGALNALTFIEDFISARVFEDFDPATSTFTRQTVSNEMGRAIECVANRYIIVSYSSGSTTSFTHAIVVDTQLSRVGKLKIPHVSVFPYKDLQGGTLQNSKSQLSFLQDDGTLQILTFDIDSINTQGVAVFGKFQYKRERWIQIQKIDCENGGIIDNFAVRLYPSYDGTKWESPVVGTFESPDMATSRNKSWFFTAAGKNCSILATGGFDLSSLIIHFNVHGKI